MDNFFDLLRSVWGVALAVLFFGGTIFIHELGHFLAARRRGLRVERFSIGFGPRIWGRTGKDGVDYRISLFPFGGYVALPQMADMSAIEGETDADEPRLPKISWADKMIVAVMGATFNILFALVLACILSAFGRPMPLASNSTVVGYIDREITSPVTGETFPSPAANSRLRLGDRILAVDGKPVSDFQGIVENVALGSKRDERGKPVTDLTVERDGVKLAGDIRIEPRVVDQTGAGDAIRVIGLRSSLPVHAEITDPNSPAAKGGMKSGDRILSVNGAAVLGFDHFKDLIAEAGEKPLALRVSRETKNGRVELDLSIAPETVAYTNALLALTVPVNGVLRSVELVPVPERLDNLAKAGDAPRTKLMVRETPPEASGLAELLPAGTIVDAVDGERLVQHVADLDAVIATALRRDIDKPVTLYVRRGEENTTVPLYGAKFILIPPKQKLAIGIAPQIRAEKVRLAPWTYVTDSLETTLRTLRALVSSDSDVGVRHLTGVVGIARIYYDIADNILNVVWFTLLINVNLAVMNLLPLPVLDGGHMVYATLEKLRGKPLRRRTVEIVQTTFVVLLLSLMAYVVFNDLRRWKAGRDAERRDLVERFVNRSRYEFAPSRPAPGGN